MDHIDRFGLLYKNDLVREKLSSAAEQCEAMNSQGITDERRRLRG